MLARTEASKLANSISHNKAFKRDSQRLAVLVQSLAFVIIAQWFASGGGVVHPLTRS